MASKQETGIGSQYKEFAQACKQAEKDLKIEKYCHIDIERRPDGQEPETLYTYDLPVSMMWEYMWVIEWRTARFICKYPRDHVQKTFAFYDKTSGLDTGYGSTLSKYVAAKALKTKYENALQAYLDSQKNMLFFDPDNDPVAIKGREKIAKAEERIQELLQTLETEKAKLTQSCS